MICKNIEKVTYSFHFYRWFKVFYNRFLPAVEMTISFFFQEEGRGKRTLRVRFPLPHQHYEFMSFRWSVATEKPIFTQ